jgi:hypothetical protein
MHCATMPDERIAILTGVSAERIALVIKHFFMMSAERIAADIVHLPVELVRRAIACRNVRAGSPGA